MKFLICNADEATRRLWITAMIEGEPAPPARRHVDRGARHPAPAAAYSHIRAGVPAGGQGAARPSTRRAPHGVIGRNILNAVWTSTSVVQEGAGALSAAWRPRSLRSPSAPRHATHAPALPSSTGCGATRRTSTWDHASVRRRSCSTGRSGSAAWARHEVAAPGLRTAGAVQNSGLGGDPHRHDAAQMISRHRRRLSRWQS